MMGVRMIINDRPAPFDIHNDNGKSELLSSVSNHDVLTAAP